MKGVGLGVVATAPAGLTVPNASAGTSDGSQQGVVAEETTDDSIEDRLTTTDDVGPIQILKTTKCSRNTRAEILEAAEALFAARSSVFESGGQEGDWQNYRAAKSASVAADRPTPLQPGRRSRSDGARGLSRESRSATSQPRWQIP